MPRRIGTLAEKSLHASLKAHYMLPGDALECDLDGYVIDILRQSADGSCHCIEIQTRNLANMKAKLLALLAHYPIRVHRIRPVPGTGQLSSQRLSSEFFAGSLAYS